MNENMILQPTLRIRELRTISTIINELNKRNIPYISSIYSGNNSISFDIAVKFSYDRINHEITFTASRYDDYTIKIYSQINGGMCEQEIEVKVEGFIEYVNNLHDLFEAFRKQEGRIEVLMSYINNK
jgi:hypothetical protein